GGAVAEAGGHGRGPLRRQDQPQFQFPLHHGVHGMCSSLVTRPVGGPVRGESGRGREHYAGRGKFLRLLRAYHIAARKGPVRRDGPWVPRRSDRCVSPRPTPTSRYGTTDMSAPTPAPGDDRPREGYYPDPSIPGYVRYWN